ncbi:transcription antiterminator NusB [Spiroplasma endosymbiont of Anurida maritima]|uniref:transcription antitermination factor NusB n=1 Tax=Spiroplasma endosymbiont of Anurida maritima TaxID=2967972 RepID=UPI0036D38AA4
MSKRKQRIEAINFLYAHYVMNLEKEDFLKTINNGVGISETISEEIINLGINVLKKEDEIVAKINEKLKHGWTFERLSNYHKAILLLGIFEINFLKIDKPIIVNEVLEILEKTSDNEDYNYINAILDGVKFENNS